MPISFRALHKASKGKSIAQDPSPESPTSSATQYTVKSVGSTASVGSTVTSESTGATSFLQAVFRSRSRSPTKGGYLSDPDSPTSKCSNASNGSSSSTGISCKYRRSRTLVRRSSQCRFAQKNQTAIVLDWDDTLFPTTFVDHELATQLGNNNVPTDTDTVSSSIKSRTSSENFTSIKSRTSSDSVQSAEQTLESNEVMNDAIEKVEQCQAHAELLLRRTQKLGHIIIATLSSRSKLKKLCKAWYPRVWKFLNDEQITIVYAIESHQPSPKSKDQAKHSEFAAGYWAWMKGRAIGKEIDRFYSQYEGQSWKNVISIGDSEFERYGTLGAASAYVSRRFSDPGTTESAAYVQGWQRFDSDADWSEGLEGNYDGHVFKVRTKVLKLIDDPSPADLSQQLILLLHWFPQIVFFDGCLNLCLENLNDKALQKVESMLAAKTVEADPPDDPFECYAPANEYSADEKTVATRNLDEKATKALIVGWELTKLITFLDDLNGKTVKALSPKQKELTEISQLAENRHSSVCPLKPAYDDALAKKQAMACREAEVVACPEADAQGCMIWC